jgi:hypothetical protein
MEHMLIFLIIGLIVIGIAGYFLFINYRRFQLIQKTDTSAISMVYNGFYEVKGKIVPQGNLLSSPFSGKQCVYYDFTVEQKKSSGKSSHWVKIIDDQRYVNFGLDDGTGVAIVDMQGADVQIKTDSKERSGMFNSANEQEKAVLEKYNQSNKTWIFEKSLRYTEKFLETGDELYVLGEVNGKEGMKPLFRKAAMPLFVSDKSENELLNYYKFRIIGSIAAIAAVVALNIWIYLSNQ